MAVPSLKGGNFVAIFRRTSLVWMGVLIYILIPAFICYSKNTRPAFTRAYD